VRNITVSPKDRVSSSATGLRIGRAVTALARIGLGTSLAAAALVGCRAGSDRTGTPTSPGFDPTREVSTINGSVPPTPVQSMHDVTVMLDTIDAEGRRLVTTRGIRPGGTRAPIHVHRYGGLTCVIEGEITDFVEGHEPMVFPAGTCYYMPPDTPMTAVSLGTVDAVLIDTFNLPPGEPTITVIEPGVAR
jgi:Cupin domain